MPVKREPCRNFQRGSCKYGAQCKFLHAIQHQQQQPNVFGFGSQAGSVPQQRNSEQEKPNPFGFGVKNNVQSTSGPKQNQFKPFENTWSRFSPLTTGNSNSSRQPANQPQGANHKCTDPDSCKRQIVEDFEHERPLWRLTCYGHQKNAPCDISGDVSYEELRAAAYDDAKRGLSLPAIIERERGLVNAKLIEFDNLQRNPYPGPSNPSSTSQSPFPESTLITSAQNTRNGAPASVSSFGQPGAMLNIGFGMKAPAGSDNAFKQSNPFQVSSQTSSAFGINTLPFGGFQSSLPPQTFGKSFGPSTSNFGSNFSTTPNVPMQVPNSSSDLPPTLPNVSNSVATGVGNGSVNDELVDNLQKREISKDDSIWLKEKWHIGEIPETPPPDAFVN